MMWALLNHCVGMCVCIRRIRKAVALSRTYNTCDETVFSLCCLIMSENFLLPPNTADEAIELHLFLRMYLRIKNTGIKLMYFADVILFR